MSRKEKKKESEKETETERELYNKVERKNRENTYFFLSFGPITIEKREGESKYARKCNSAILFRIRLALKPFIHSISIFFSSLKKCVCERERTNFILFIFYFVNHSK